MLMPKRIKYRRLHRSSYERRAKAGREVPFSEYGLVADTGTYVSNRQIEAVRIVMTRYMKHDGKVQIRASPHMTRAGKPLEVCMGSGKGAPEEWVATMKSGRVMFGIAGVSEEVAHEASRLAAHKLPVKTKSVVRKGGK